MVEFEDRNISKVSSQESMIHSCSYKERARFKRIKRLKAILSIPVSFICLIILGHYNKRRLMIILHKIIVYVIIIILMIIKLNKIYKTAKLNL